MKETADLPEQQPMPADLQDRIWAGIEPRLGPTASRFRTLRAPLAAAASVVAATLGIASALPLSPGHDVQVAAGPDAQVVEQCVQAGGDTLDPGTWRAGARLDLDSSRSYLVIRTDTAAAVCIITSGQGTGLVGGIARNDPYSELTAARPFDYLMSDNLATESIHFGITAGDVATVSLIGPDNSSSPGVVRDGTFIVRTKIAEDSSRPTTNHLSATLANGHTVQGPLRSG